MTVAEQHVAVRPNVVDDPAHHASFLRQFLKSPGTVGAVAPSSPRLAARMMAAVDFSKAGVVLEYGPGTGAFTGAILERLRPGAKFVAVELSPSYSEILAKRFPAARIVNDSVANIEAICRAEGIPERGGVDVVLSGLPWASFSDELQDEILMPMLRVLKPGGVFVTFGYHIGTFLPAGKRFYAKARRLFARVDRSELVWLNVPPAFVMRCETRGT
ncbi:MAG: class I SAM-dependent methyltransferase [Phycisphaerales bacterium]